MALPGDNAGRRYNPGTQYLIRSGKQGLVLLTRKVLTGHRYREVIESLSKSKFCSFLRRLSVLPLCLAQIIDDAGEIRAIISCRTEFRIESFSMGAQRGRRTDAFRRLL